MAELRFSIILCTRNRAHILLDALESIFNVDYPTDAFELIVVDNGSTDATRDVVEAFAERATFAVCCIDEPRKGLSNARNRGIAVATGRWLFFTDDDQLVDRRALREHERVATRYGARAQQGAIALVFPDGRPSWLRDRLNVVLGETDERPEGIAKMDLFGGNMVFRRDLFDDLDGFDPDLGKGAAGYSEDIEITRRLADIGEPIAYAPTARVFHVIKGDRATPGFLRRSSYEKGYSDGVRLRAERRGLAIGGRALWALVSGAGQGAWGLVSRDRYFLVLAQTRVVNHLGKVAGYLFARARRAADSCPVDSCPVDS